GLVNGQTYHYQATAVAVAGEGPRSQNASAVPSGLPSPPLGFNVSAGGAGVASLQWTPPYDDGGFTITTYRLHRGPDPGNMTLYRDAGSVFVFDDTGLPAGVSKCYAVAAVTSRGEGAYADTLCVVPKGLASQPTAASGHANGSSIEIQWGLPANNGSDAISGFALYRGTAAGALALLASPGANDTSYEDEAVTWGTAYFYQVAAVNSVGEGARTAEVRVLAGAPAASPSGFSSDGTGGVVTLTWSGPSSTGGWPVTGFRIYRTEVLEHPQQGVRQLIAQLGPATSYTDQNVTPGRQYEYEVAAVTEFGEGQGARHISFVLPPAAAGGEWTWLLVALAVIGVGAVVVARRYGLGRVEHGVDSATAPAARGGAGVAPPILVPAKPEGPAYLVENVFLLYQDGRAIFTRGGL
ncbi:MAG: fibronectin type III domain-containing protein, partial [Actinomycetota bacterium]